MISAEKMKTLFREWRENLALAGRPDEWESKDLMNRAGLPVPAQYLLKQKELSRDLTDLSFLPADMKPPYVVKLCSADVIHKTDVGGVQLDVSTEQLSSVLGEMKDRFPGENMLIYHMESIKGPEFILGALKDPSFGPAVMVGAGGIMTELYKDVSFCLAPCTLRDADNILGELTIAPVLHGFRGSRMEAEPLKEIIVRFSLLAAAAAEEDAQLDINPIVWNGTGWTVLDAKCVFT